MRANIITKSDKWLIGILLCLSFTGIALQLFYFLYAAQDQVKAEIQVDGKLFKTVSLLPGYTEEIRIGGQKEYAIIEVRDGKIRIREDDSPYQIGVKTGWISKVPQQIVNLPYRISITLVSNQSGNLDSIAH